VSPKLSRRCTNQKDTRKRKDRRTIPWLTTPCPVLAGRRSSRPAAGIACPAEDSQSRTAVAVEGSHSLVLAAAAGMEDNMIVGRRLRRSSLRLHLAAAERSCYRRMIAGGMRVDRLGRVGRIPAAGLLDDRIWALGRE